MAIRKKKINITAYYGGKSSQSEPILKILEQIPHTFYVECFGGLAALLLNKQPKKVEVYNDRDGALVALLTVLRERPQELVNLIDLTPYARDEYINCYTKLHNGEIQTELEMARVAWTLLKTTFNSTLTSGGFSTGGLLRSTSVASELHNTRHFPSVSSRLRSVFIENKDWLEIYNLYNGPEALIYLDPPYHPETRPSKGYRFEWDREQHIAMIDIIKHTKAKVVLSGYQHEDYDCLLDCGWEKLSHEAQTMYTGNAKRKYTEECLWLSPQAYRNTNNWSLFSKQ
jgi:DNA adenine methylase